MSSTVLNTVRKRLAELGNSEFAAREDQPALVDMWEKMQDLREEMNEAKKTAAAEAAKPYQEAITEIEKRYAMLLKLSA